MGEVDDALILEIEGHSRRAMQGARQRLPIGVHLEVKTGSGKRPGNCCDASSELSFDVCHHAVICGGRAPDDEGVVAGSRAARHAQYV